METTNAVQELKSERVQEELRTVMKRRILGPGDTAGSAMTRNLTGRTVVLALTGRSKGPARGITEEVLDLAEQLG